MAKVTSAGSMHPCEVKVLISPSPRVGFYCACAIHWGEGAIVFAVPLTSQLPFLLRSATLASTQHLRAVAGTSSQFPASGPYVFPAAS